MNTRKFGKVTSSMIILVILAAFTTASGMPQLPRPAYPERREAWVGGITSQTRIQQAIDGRWYMPAGFDDSRNNPFLTLQESGVLDDFGYTWDGTNPYSWIDATGGTDTGMSGDSWDQAVGPVGLPFPFKFYENSYTSLYIAAAGYLSFSQANPWDSQSMLLDPTLPNNVIAPNWTPTYIGAGASVHYLAGGIAPNRYFVVEWHDVRGGDPEDPIGSDDLYRYEVVLHENGDIIFNYYTMSIILSRYCGDIGIEDGDGLDGFSIGGYCNQGPPSGASVRIYRPATSSARVRLLPEHDGQFTSSGGVSQFQLVVRNRGDFGDDTFDLTTVSTWPVTLYQANGITPLGDSDGDAMPDTGLLAQGASQQIVAKVQAPQTAGVGDSNSLAITASSSIDPSVSMIYSARSAVPTHFAQALTGDPIDSLDIMLAQPMGVNEKSVVPGSVYGEDMAVAELPGGGFILVWNNYDCYPMCMQELYYAILDGYGTIVRAAEKLTDHSNATLEISDDGLVVSVTPDGHIGLIWVREIFDRIAVQNNYNVYTAILEPDGSIGYGPQNLTNNNLWGAYYSSSVPRFSYPSIAATGDGRFVLAWDRRLDYVSNIFYSIIDSQNSTIVPITQMTANGNEYGPTVTELTGNRALVAYFGTHGGTYLVIDSNGGIVKNETYTYEEMDTRDAVQLSDGNILLAYNEWNSTFAVFKYMIIDGTTYDVVGLPYTLVNPAVPVDQFQISVAADAQNQALLTWTDDTFRSVYYALVDHTGNILTPPMILKNGNAKVYTSFTGCGVTTYHPPKVYLPLVVR